MSSSSVQLMDLRRSNLLFTTNEQGDFPPYGEGGGQTQPPRKKKVTISVEMNDILPIDEGDDDNQPDGGSDAQEAMQQLLQDDELSMWIIIFERL